MLASLCKTPGIQGRMKRMFRLDLRRSRQSSRALNSGQRQALPITFLGMNVKSKDRAQKPNFPG
jgi:uncharacterized protein (DUF3084 family)